VTVQELIDWLEGAKDPDGVEGVDPNAPVKVALTPDGGTSLSIPTMAGETLLLPLEPEVWKRETI